MTNEDDIEECENCREVDVDTTKCYDCSLEYCTHCETLDDGCPHCEEDSSGNTLSSNVDWDKMIKEHVIIPENNPCLKIMKESMGKLIDKIKL